MKKIIALPTLVFLPLFFISGCSSKVVNYYVNQLPSLETPSLFSDSEKNTGNETLDAFFAVYQKDAIWGASAKDYQAMLAKKRGEDTYMLDISGCIYTLKKSAGMYDRYFVDTKSKYQCRNQAAKDKVIDRVEIVKTNGNWVKLIFHNPQNDQVKYTAFMEKLKHFYTASKPPKTK